MLYKFCHPECNAMIQKKHLSGFSLIELLITLVIVSFMIAAVLFSYSKNNELTRLQDQRARVQENLRFAADLLARDIRQAGFKTCLSDAVAGQIRLGAGIIDGTGANILRAELWNVAPVLGIDNVRTNPVLTLAPGNTRTGAAQGVQGSGGYTIGHYENLVRADSFDGAATGNTGANTLVPDRLYIRTVINGPASPSGALTVGATTLNLNRPLLDADPSAPGSVQRFILIADCANRRGELIQVKSGRQNLTLETATVFPYPPTAQVYEVAFLQYDIMQGTIAGQNVLSLARRPLGDIRQSVVPNIENLQVLYGVDTSADKDGSAIQYLRADQVATAAYGWRDVVALQITLVGRADANKVQAYTKNGQLDYSQLRYLLPGELLPRNDPFFAEPKDTTPFVPRQSLTFRIALRN
jgi:prepilin-type N-terminal cleavage/methylation domain-containing protein